MVNDRTIAAEVRYDKSGARKFSAQGRLVWRERSKDYTGYDKPIREFACRSWIGHISADYTIDDGRGVACCVKGDTIASHIVRSIPDMQAVEGDGSRSSR